MMRLQYRIVLILILNSWVCSAIPDVQAPFRSVRQVRAKDRFRVWRPSLNFSIMLHSRVSTLFVFSLALSLACCRFLSYNHYNHNVPFII
ncbi:uncharacterized protein EI90DRAFT_3028120 [Cantharellus anzutake]|uniref:uncharacterized protein n=1 Tax=Cantharellus anzutake TaxID=1750568 RepID=UPI001904B75E|nr:uncharacterized protein EI90DRAFT_3028120 [Cantharellus anzutake]KAF8344053.1 hypothetical protein EI90DRAFT_3028120 [Cantharellus anzutake]